MNYQIAVKNIEKDSSMINIKKQTKALLDEMTLDEKIKLTCGVSAFKMLSRMIYGLLRGAFLMMPFLSGGCERLGIPQIVFSDGPRGIVIGRNTCFPVASMRAASFDDEMEERVAKSMAKELIASGANYFGGICINVVRNPRWGRAAETYGEDTYMLGRKGAILTRVMQDEGVIACPKHFALNSIENLRFQVDVHVSDRALREVYLQQFQKCIDAGAASIMSAYNQVRGTYCAENKELLTDILRGEMGFDGFVMSDFMSGVHDCIESYEAGNDIEMPLYGTRKKASKKVGEGALNPKLIETAAANVLQALLTVTPKRKQQSKSVCKCPEHIALAREVATKGNVLLKNNGVLPVSLNAKIAVVGPFANTVNVGDNGSSSIWCKDGVTPYEGLKAQYKNVSVYNGLDPNKAVEASKESTVVIVVVGSDRHREGELLNNNIAKLEKDPDNRTGGDRSSLRLRSEETKMIKALKSDGKKVVVSLLSGSVFITKDFEEYADGIFMSFYGGVQAGNALADLVSGKENPCGKMPFTIANDENEYPRFLEVGERPYKIEYGYYHGYSLFDKEGITPAYPFGFGLSYTTFEMRDHLVRKTDSGFQVAVKVKNTGSRVGAEVVQVYVGSAGSDEDRPVKLLRGYQRIELSPYEEKTVVIDVDANDLRFYHPETKSWEWDKEYIFYVGNDSRNVVRLAETVKI